VDDDAMVLRLIQKTLGDAGFSKVLTAVDVPMALTVVETYRPILVLVDLDLGPGTQNGIDLIRQLKPFPEGPIPVVLSGNKTPEQLLKAARAGAIDFLVKGPGVDIAKEVRSILDGERGVAQERTLSEIVSDLGYLRSFGLSQKEIDLLIDFANGFPKFSDLAERQHQPPVQLRKYFSKIYSKLDIPDANQLIQILTICAFFNKEH
jgi:DNA-binding NarL/FixJ family response regulator